MDFLLNRYRNLSVLLVAILSQLALLAYQVKTGGDVRLIRFWAISAVTPLARLIDTGRSSVSNFFRDYFVLLDVREANKRMKAELERVEMENQYLRAELSTADRATALAIFQKTSPSKTLAARVIGNTTDSGAKAVIVDRGSISGVQKGMAVITPEGIVGKVISVYPTASYVLLITDPSFAAGVVSQKNHVHGTLKGQGHSTVVIDYVQNEQPVEEGEWFLTSGDDLIFPRGIPAGQVVVVKPGKARKEIYLTPSGLQNGLEDVLIIVEGVHGALPDVPPSNQPVHLLAPPGEESAGAPISPGGSSGPGRAGAPTESAGPATAPASGTGPMTDADRIRQQYRAIGEAQNHVYGDGKSKAPNFNAPLPAPRPAAAAPPGPDH
ncbi:MAG TPA: rod shape-determining protein MreC [Bryobacteraceae bacterium]|nr:rod shape-determining protein MreC [Bryobacteraceae bacterium]